MLLQSATNTTWWFPGLFISVWNDSTWGCVIFWFTYISLSFWVEMLEACLVDEIHLTSEQETDGRLNSRKKKRRRKTKQKTHQYTRFSGLCRRSKCWLLVLPAPPWALARMSYSVDFLNERRNMTAFVFLWILRASNFLFFSNSVFHKTKINMKWWWRSSVCLSVCLPTYLLRESKC